MAALLSAAFSGALVMMTMTDPAPTPAASPSTPSVSDALFRSAERRVRAADPVIQALLTEGFDRSPSLAGLLLAINRTNVIVYIERVMAMPKETLGRLTMVPIPAATRYLRIQVRSDLTRYETIALIGHELQHALEVAADATVRDTNGMIALYERIGHSSGGEHVYDTTAAQEMGRQVRRELTTASDPHRGDSTNLSAKKGSAALPAGPTVK
jgi:hypothetical protein